MGVNQVPYLFVESCLCAILIMELELTEQWRVNTDENGNKLRLQDRWLSHPSLWLLTCSCKNSYEADQIQLTLSVLIVQASQTFGKKTPKKLSDSAIKTFH